MSRWGTEALDELRSKVETAMKAGPYRTLGEVKMEPCEKCIRKGRNMKAIMAGAAYTVLIALAVGVVIFATVTFSEHHNSAASYAVGWGGGALCLGLVTVALSHVVALVEGLA